MEQTLRAFLLKLNICDSLLEKVPKGAYYGRNLLLLRGCLEFGRFKVAEVYFSTDHVGNIVLMQTVDGLCRFIPLSPLWPRCKINNSYRYPVVTN